jgi:hypothetical protein
MFRGDGARARDHSTAVRLMERHWYLVAASFDARTAEVWLGQHGLRRYADRVQSCAESVSNTPLRPAATAVFRLAACVADRTRLAAGRAWPGCPL